MPELGEFNAIGTGKRLALKEAVFLNGLNSHALDFDDGTIRHHSPRFLQFFHYCSRWLNDMILESKMC